MFSQCSSIQRCAARMPGCRHAAGTQRSSTLSTRSTPRKKLVQRKPAGRAPRRLAAVGAEQLGDAELGGQRPHRLEIRHDRQRHDDRPRPGRHRTQAEAQTRRDQDQLGRNARAFVVADLAQKREVKPREAVALVRTAGIENRLPGTNHRRVIGRRSHELECEIRLDRSADLRRAAGIDRPPAVALLLIPDIPCTSAHRPGRIRGPERPSARRIRTRGSYPPRARRPSNLRRSAAPAASCWFARGRFPARRQRRIAGCADRREVDHSRSTWQDASVLVGDHAFPTLSLIPRCLFVGKTTSNVSRLI